MLEDAVQSGVGYDDCIDNAGEFKMRRFVPGVLRPWKRIEYRDGIPYARHRHAGDLPMKCLHFHGGFKVLMDRHARCEEDDWSVATMMLQRKVAHLPAKYRLFARNYLTAPRIANGLQRRRAA